MRTTIQKISTAEVGKLELLAKEIWEEYYGGIFGAEETAKLIEKLQNADKINQEMQSGYSYYFIKIRNQVIGYFNFTEKGSELYCGKLYILKNFRGLGLGKEIFKSLEKEAILLGKQELRLSVNSTNEASVRFYTTQGMKIEQTETNQLSENITSIDFIMEKDICPVEKSLRYFYQGYNCSQSVVMAFAPFFDIKPEHVITMGLAFGGGFSRTRNLCGAMSGIGMIVSHVLGTTSPNSKDEIYEATRKLTSKFEDVNSNILCGEILKNVKNITTTPRSEPRTAAYYAKRPCAKVVENAAEITLEFLQEEHKKGNIKF